MPGSQILHSKTRSVKFNRIGIVSCELANGKKIANHLRQQEHWKDEKDQEQNSRGVT
jgi:hypothetical protein